MIAISILAHISSLLLDEESGSVLKNKCFSSGLNSLPSIPHLLNNQNKISHLSLKWQIKTTLWFLQKGTLFHHIVAKLYNILGLNKRKYNIQLGWCTAMSPSSHGDMAVPPVLLWILHSHVKHLKHSRNQTEFMLLEVFYSYLYNLCVLYTYKYTHTNMYLHTLYITYYINIHPDISYIK